MRAAEPALDGFENVVAEYVLKYAKRNTRERSWREVERLPTRETTAWHGRRLCEIRRAAEAVATLAALDAARISATEGRVISI
jgi:hypothetical protein